MNVVDLRSDTVTRATPEMLLAMTTAEVGDDVFGDDPSVIRLQAETAELLGKQAALLVPTGTMANQLCIRAQTEAGDEIIVEAQSHIFLNEGAAYAAVSGVGVACVSGERGLMTAADVERAIRGPGSRSHFPVSTLICLENPSNYGGGSVYPLDQVDEIATVARSHGLRLHLDGARIFNAALALGVGAAAMAAPFDSVSVCLSKGLGCPWGSLVVGSERLIARAHRFRKMLGGGMRQAGHLAAAGSYALSHHRERLTDDHRRARALARGLVDLPGFGVKLDGVETNMVFADLETGAASVVEAMKAHGILIGQVGERRIRAVTHLDVDDAGIERALHAFRRVAGG